VRGLLYISPVPCDDFELKIDYFNSSWIKEYDSLKTARLIFENQIVSICSAMIKERAFHEVDYANISCSPRDVW